MIAFIGVSVFLGSVGCVRHDVRMAHPVADRNDFPAVDESRQERDSPTTPADGYRVLSPLGCDSPATPVSMKAEVALISDVVEFLAWFSHTPLDMPGSFPVEYIEISVDQEPWDCVLERVLSIVHYRAELVESGIRIRRDESVGEPDATPSGPVAHGSSRRNGRP